MKKIILLSAFVFCSVFSGFAQINPVQNLQYSQYYDFGNYFTLEWDPPQEPHDPLLGYKVYRDDDLYQV